MKNRLYASAYFVRSWSVRRIAATKWPERETVADATQGVSLATMQKLAHYWQTEHDWRKAEAATHSQE